MDELALIILNYNSFEDTLKCVKQLQSFNETFKIIIVDNKSTDESFQMLKKEKIENENTILIETDKNGGYSYGNNYGVKYAEKIFKLKTIAILNPDVIIPNVSILKKMYKYLYEDEKYAMIGGIPIEAGRISISSAGWEIPSYKKVVLDRSLFVGSLFKSRSDLYMINDHLAKIECLVGCFFMIKLDVFKKINYFDEGVFLYNEENILGIKVKKEGYQGVIAPRLLYYHNHDFSKESQNLSLMNKMKKLKIRYISRRYLIKKYYKRYLVPFLFFIEGSNALKISLGHLKNKISR